MRQTEGIIAQILEKEDANKIEIIKLENDVIEIFVDGNSVCKTTHYYPKVKNYDQFKDYSRHPIQISSQNIIVIHHFSDRSMGQVFEAHDMLEENINCAHNHYSMYESAANQLFDQLEGQYSDAFLEALIVKATKILAEGDKERKAFNDKVKKSDCEIESRAQKALNKAKLEII